MKEWTYFLIPFRFAVLCVFLLLGMDAVSAVHAHRQQRSIESITTTIDASQSYQSLIGVGGALTESTAALLSQASANASHWQNSLAAQVLNTLFKQAQFSVVRIPMGSCDFHMQPFFSYDDLRSTSTETAGTPTDFNLSHFSLDKDALYSAPWIRRVVQSYPQIQFIATPWSPPGWMKDSGTMQGGSFLTTNASYLSAYGEYFVRFVKGYKQRFGIDHISYVAMQNEPRYSTSGYPTMSITAAVEARMILAVIQAFQAHGIGPEEVQILVYDHNWDDPQYPIDVLMNLTSLMAAQTEKKGSKERNSDGEHLSSESLRVASDEGAVPLSLYIGGIAWHCYAGDVSAQSVLHAQFPNLLTFFTECSGGAWATNFTSNLVWDVQNLVVGATRNWASTVLKWNLALNSTGGPKLPGGCENCRGIVTVDVSSVSSSSSTLTLNEDFYALAHLSQFVPPTRASTGVRSVRVSSSDTNSVTWMTTAANRTTATYLTLVGVNPGPMWWNYTLRVPCNGNTSRSDHLFSNCASQCASLVSVPPGAAFTAQWTAFANTTTFPVRWWVTGDYPTSMRLAPQPTAGWHACA